jgi:hypothetical protein
MPTNCLLHSPVQNFPACKNKETPCNPFLSSDCGSLFKGYLFLDVVHPPLWEERLCQREVDDPAARWSPLTSTAFFEKKAAQKNFYHRVRSDER